ncbi:MAG: hypothetical protein Q7R35_13770, partial [Elusimicrobiota bacterium]|nr:hypothetical protein [Elusimicrobiota bacterium]
RTAVRWPQGNRPCCPVRQQADSPAYCRLPVGANVRLLALSRSLPCRATAELGVNAGTIEGTSSGERRYNPNPAFAGFPAKRVEAKRYARQAERVYASRRAPAMRAENFIGSFQAKARPCGPTNRAAAAAGQRGFSRVGGANGRQCCRRIRGARLDWRPRMAVTWLFKDAALACAVYAGLAGHRFREERPEAAVPALPPGKGGAAAARAVSADHNVYALVVKRGVE